MAIQRNALVAPFSVNSPLLDGGKSVSKSTLMRENSGKPQTAAPPNSGVVAITHQKWFGQVAQAINLSVQLSTKIPASSVAPGEPGTLVPFAGGFYFCVGSNSWLKFTGAPF